MKKFLLMLCITLVASIASAEYMYWQLDTSDYTEAKEDDVITAQLKYGEDEDSVVSMYALVYDSVNDEWVLSDTPTDTIYPNATYAIDTTKMDTTDAYSYYVEVSKNGSVVDDYAGSKNTMTGSEFKSYTDTAVVSGDLTDGIKDMVAPVWHASTGGMSPAPEPTSAILMMFGMAFLGLKRKNRSIA